MCLKNHSSNLHASIYGIFSLWARLFACGKLEFITHSPVFPKIPPPQGRSSSLSEEFAQCVAQQMGNAVFVTDREKVVAVAGYTGEDIVGEPISHILENILDDRDERLPLSERNRFIPVIHGMEEHEQICQAIRSNGQIIGAIIIQAKDRKQRLGESEKKIALVAAEFLGKQVSV